MRTIFPFAAAAAMLSLPACGSDPDREARAGNEARAMAEAADGSAAKAVGDLMSDPSVRDQLGMPSVPASAPTAITPVDPSPSADPSQVRALALCRALTAARAGGPLRTGPEADARAAEELKADPAALSKCQSG